MLDLKYIRENTAEVKENLKKLNTTAPIDEIIALDEKRRELIKKTEELKNIRNTTSKEIANLSDKAKREKLISEMHKTNEKIKSLDNELNQTETKLAELLLLVPNMPHPKTPVGKDESENVFIKDWGKPKELSFLAKPHWELGEKLGIIDFERGVKISGTRFYVLKALGAKLQRALITFMLDLHTKKHGYTEIYPPAIVKRQCMIGTAQLPKFGDNLYRDAESDMWFAPTAEVPVTNLYSDEILSYEDLPVHNVAYTPCFRKEKMSAGKDTRGIKRGHQFDKVELVKITAPENSDEELEKLLENAAEVLRQLNLPYRVIQMCTGDLSFSAAVKYDLEVYSPGCDEWLEVSSCSNFLDFQARRANIKFKRNSQSKPEFVHTLNGSGLALPRTLIAVLENYQKEDGTIQVPEALQPYMDGVKVIK